MPGLFVRFQYKKSFVFFNRVYISGPPGQGGKPACFYDEDYEGVCRVCGRFYGYGSVTGTDRIMDVSIVTGTKGLSTSTFSPSPGWRMRKEKSFRVA
jgi:hypothetical protein